MPVRIFRRVISPVPYAVVIIVPVFPTTATQFPTIVVLNPLRLSIAVAVTLVLPVASAPNVVIAMHIPIAGNPNVTGARWRNVLHAWRRWRHVQIDADLSVGDRRYCDRAKR